MCVEFVYCGKALYRYLVLERFTKFFTPITAKTLFSRIRVA